MKTDAATKVRYKAIPYFPGYLVGNDGSVWTRKNGRWGLQGHWREVAQGWAKGTYRMVYLYRDGKKYGLMVARLVLEAFCRDQSKAQRCQWRNGDRTDNRIENLEWEAR